jgi:hypothetical protein
MEENEKQFAFPPPGAKAVEKIFVVENFSAGKKPQNDPNFALNTPGFVFFLQRPRWPRPQSVNIA